MNNLLPAMAVLVNIPFDPEAVANGVGFATNAIPMSKILNGPWLLFDNHEDPYQLTYLIDSHPELVEHLSQKLESKLALYGDEFLPEKAYLDRWGWKTKDDGTVPYGPHKGVGMIATWQPDISVLPANSIEERLMNTGSIIRDLPQQHPLAQEQGVWVPSLTRTDYSWGLFRCTLDLDEPIDQATLWWSGSQRCTLWLNGELLADGPPRSDRETWGYVSTTLPPLQSRHTLFSR